jgi:hypothetical protein
MDKKQASEDMVTKDQVIAALKQMKASGITDPYDTFDPRSKEAQGLLSRWYKQFEALNLKGKAELEANLERNTILIDAGYDDAEMLDSASEWLEQDLQAAEGLGDQELVLKIKNKLADIQSKMG